ncbi:hypothetical protein HDU96_000558 [Phlyctochytrium bullatum]|nr:hypothetical protein HDU96_000558 [Phlyctochytrium bullatum]
MLMRRVLLRRPFSTGPFPASSSVAPPPPTPRGPGFIKGSLLGFLVGVSITGGAAYVYLLEDYHKASQSVLVGVEDLQKSTNKIQSNLKKIETVDKGLEALKKQAASKDELEKVRNELLKVIDEIHLSHLELKTQVFDLGQDLKDLKK